MLPMDVDMPPVEDALATAAATTVGEMDTTMDAGGAGEVTNDMTTMIQPPEHGFVLEPLAVGAARMNAHKRACTRAHTHTHTHGCQGYTICPAL